MAPPVQWHACDEAKVGAMSYHNALCPWLEHRTSFYRATDNRQQKTENYSIVESERQDVERYGCR